MLAELRCCCQVLTACKIKNFQFLCCLQEEEEEIYWVLGMDVHILIVNYMKMRKIFMHLNLPPSIPVFIDKTRGKIKNDKIS